jgi:hypothetical protein
MGAYADPVFFCQMYRFSHDVGVSAMIAAGNACGGNIFHHLFIVSQLIEAETFAHIAVQINLHRGNLSRPDIRILRKYLIVSSVPGDSSLP